MKVLKVRQGIGEHADNYVVEGVENSTTPKIGETIPEKDLRTYCAKTAWRVVIK